MRRVIRGLLRGQEPGKPEVMENPEAVDAVREAVEELKRRLGTDS